MADIQIMTGGGICDETEAFFAFAQGIFGGGVRSIRSAASRAEHIEESEIFFCRGNAGSASASRACREAGPIAIAAAWIARRGYRERRYSR